MPTHVSIETRISPDHLFTITRNLAAGGVSCDYCDDPEELRRIITADIYEAQILALTVVRRDETMVAFWNREALDVRSL